MPRHAHADMALCAMIMFGGKRAPGGDQLVHRTDGRTGVRVDDIEAHYKKAAAGADIVRPRRTRRPGYARGHPPRDCAAISGRSNASVKVEEGLTAADMSVHSPTALSCPIAIDFLVGGERLHARSAVAFSVDDLSDRLSSLAGRGSGEGVDDGRYSRPHTVILKENGDPWNCQVR